MTGEGANTPPDCRPGAAWPTHSGRTPEPPAIANGRHQQQPVNLLAPGLNPRATHVTLLIVAAVPPTQQPEFSGLVCALFALLEDQPADLEIQLLGVGEVIDDAQRLILAR